MIENFGRYQLVERIALGGFAEIFRAHAVGIAGFEKTLAIKRLHPRYSQDSDFIAWMVDEAKITSQLSHSNICQVLDFAKVDGHYFMAMEYISGRDVYRIMKKLRETKAPAPIELVAFVGREACAGLDYTHRKRDAEGNTLDIVHRDMSPQNVMVSLDGDVKIIDFGIAKSRARGYETEAGIIKGKFFYMSPEQARGEELDSGTDIFSLGIVLWELVTGELLYKDDDEVTLLSQVRRAAINAPNTIRPEIPNGLNRIIVKALSRNREERYKSAFEMQKDLERFLIRHNSKYGKDQVGYWMRSTFYEDLPAKEVQNIDSFRHRADFIAEERSLIGQVYSAEDMTRPHQEGDSGLYELGSDMIQAADSQSSSSVVISKGVGAGQEFFDDAVTAAVDSIIPSSSSAAPTPTSPVVNRSGIPQVEPGYPSAVEVRQPVAQAAPQGSNAPAAPWSQKATFEHSSTEVGEVAPAPAIAAKAPPVGSNLIGQAQRTLSPIVHSISGKLSGRFRQERVYVALMLLVIMGGAVALTAHLKGSKTTPGISTSDMSSQWGVDDDDCQEYVLKDDKRMCAQAPSRASTAPSKLVIRTNPSGATVFINENRHSGKTPTTVSLPANSRGRLTLSLPNYQTVNETIQMPGVGKRLIVERTLEKPLGTLVVTSNPAGAKITLDREYKGRTPNTIGNLRLDRTQVLRIERDGFKSQTRSISWTETGKSVERNLQFDLVRVSQPVKRKVGPRKKKKKRKIRRPKRRAPPPAIVERERQPIRRAPEPKRSKGKLRVQTRPWATVSLNGRALGDAPTEKSVLEGNYRLKVCFEGDRSRCVVRRITVNGNRETMERFRE
jgi:eukaryotic-like serine/threonine-protein kinase